MSQDSKTPNEPTITSPYCRLIVKDFLTLKDVDCEFRGINIIIGPQAEGKSLILKLLFFCFEYFLRMLVCAVAKKNISHDEKDYIVLFSEAFLIDDDVSNFSIFFSCNGHDLTIKKDKQISFSYGEKTQYTFAAIQFETKQSDELSAQAFISHIINNCDKYPLPFRASSTLVVDTRVILTSFLAANIFRMIAANGNLTMDYFFKHYTTVYEAVKNSFTRTKNSSNILFEKSPHNFDAEFISTINGVYRIIDGREFIIHKDGTKVPLEKCSSGQQESIPLLLFLLTLEGKAYKNRFFGIEEPEAHLYPTAQKNILENIVLAYNKRQCQDTFCITTHSPYLLSTLNNCITAAEVAHTNDASKIAQMEKVLSKDKWIPYDNVRCYYVKDGTAQNIMDDKYRLIDASAIDDVSNELANSYQDMMDILQ